MDGLSIIVLVTIVGLVARDCVEQYFNYKREELSRKEASKWTSPQ